MKKWLLYFLLSFSLFANGIHWYNSVAKAQAAAEKENKILFVFIEAANCPYCEQMKSETLSDKDVIRNINNDYIALNVDIDSQDGQKYFKQVSMTPTIYFFSPNDKLLESLEGFQNSEFFFWGMGKAEKKFDQLKAAK